MTTRTSSLLLDVTDALLTAMERADAALDAGNIEAWGIWREWEQTLSAHLSDLAARQ